MTIVISQRGLAQSAAMQDTLAELQAAIGSHGGVTVSGERGTGREIVARAIHQAAHGMFDGSLEDLLRGAMRPQPVDGAFVVIDCAASSGLEGRLFGGPTFSDRASLDGAEVIDEGCALHRALGGTLVLRQLPEMSARLQRRLARILRDDAVLVAGTSGSPVMTPVSVRPIAIRDFGASDVVAPELMRFVSQTHIDLPPLRQRREDLPALIACVLADICADLSITGKTLSTQAMSLLTALRWRENITELRNVLLVLVLKTSGKLIRLDDVLTHVRLDGGPATFVYTGTLREAREQFERDYVQAVLQRHRGRMADAAKSLGLQRTNLYRKVRRLSLSREATTDGHDEAENAI